MALPSYSPEDITVLIGGLIPITGFMDGTFLTISKDLSPFSTERTSDGQVARLYNNDQTYTITLTLHNTSGTNDVLTRLWQIDEITQRGKFPLLIKDQLGTGLFFSTTTWIESVPDLEYTDDISPRVWVLRSSQGVINIGGNEKQSTLVDDLVSGVLSAIPILEGLI